MGVHKLWGLLRPTGRRVRLEELRGKRLAIDASIWLNQFVKAMRDSSGRLLANAPLKGLWSRILKLLYYKIKPVFVFDGSTPAIKKRTTEKRKQARDKASKGAQASARSILLHRHLLETLKKQQEKSQNPDSTDTLNGESENITTTTNTIINISDPTTPDVKDQGGEDDVRIESSLPLLETVLSVGNTELEKLNISKTVFASLPLELQMEVLEEIKHRKKRRSTVTTPFNGDVKFIPSPSDFSSMQISSLISTGDRNRTLNSMVNSYGSPTGTHFRVASNKDRHFVLQATDTEKVKANEGKDKEESSQRQNLSGVFEKDSMVSTITASLKRETSDFDSNAFGGFMGEENEGNFFQGKKNDKSPNNTPMAGFFDVESHGENKRADEEVILDGIDWVESGTAEPQCESRQNLCDSSESVEWLEGTEDQQSSGGKDNPVEVIDIDDIDWEESEDSITNTNTKSNSGAIHIVFDPNSIADPAELDLIFGEEEEVTEEKSIKKRKRKDEMEVQPREKKRRTDESDVKEMEEVIKGWEEDTEELERLVLDNEEEEEGYDLEEDEDKGLEEEKGVTNAATLEEFEVEWEGGDNEATEQDGEEKEIEEKRERDIELEWKESKENEIEKVPITTEPEKDETKENIKETVIAYDEGSNVVIDVEQLYKKNRFHTEINRESWQERSNFFHSVKETEIKKAEVKETEIKKAEVKETDERKDLNSDLVLEKRVSKFKIGRKAKKTGNERMSSERAPQVLPNEPKKAPKKLPNDEIKPKEKSDEGGSHPRVRSDLLDDLNDDLVREYVDELQAKFNVQSQQSQHLGDVLISETQNLLRAFGIPFITSPTEADPQCATLEKLGIISDDNDMFLFGARRMYSHLFHSKEEPALYSSKNIESDLGLTREDLITLAYLLGSDYTEGVKGIGPTLALEIISEFQDDILHSTMNTLTSFSKWARDPNSPNDTAWKKKHMALKKKLEFTSDFPNPAINKAYTDPQVDKSREDFSWEVPNLNRLRIFAAEKFGWDQKTTDEKILPAIKSYNATVSGQPTSGQATLFTFFSRKDPEDREAASQITSKRVLNVVKQLRKEKDDKEAKVVEIEVEKQYPKGKAAKNKASKGKTATGQAKKEKTKAGKEKTKSSRGRKPK